MTMFKNGDRVRMVQTGSKGTIVGEVHKSPVDGGDRISIKWDNTSKVNAWNPAFLRPADSNPSEDPDEVIAGNTRRRRCAVSIRGGWITLVIPEGFSQVTEYTKELETTVRQEKQER